MAREITANERARQQAPARVRLYVVVLHNADTGVESVSASPHTSISNAHQELLQMLTVLGHHWRGRVESFDYERYDLMPAHHQAMSDLLNQRTSIEGALRKAAIDGGLTAEACRDLADRFQLDAWLKTEDAVRHLLNEKRDER